MTMIIAPLKNKSDVKGEQNAKRAAQKAERRASEHAAKGTDGAEAPATSEQSQTPAE